MKKNYNRFGSLPQKQQLLLHAANERASRCFAQGRHEEALQACLQAIRIAPRLAPAWADAAANSVKLGRWQDGVNYAMQAMKLGAASFNVFDALSHAYTGLGNTELRDKFGRMALEQRERTFGKSPPFPHSHPASLPPPPSTETRDKNIISFSLFGRLSKYCEPAVLNATEQASLYPYWTCRFYIDDSVPGHVVTRLKAAGAQIVQLTDEDAAKKWPGPMWRLLALQDRSLHRVVFRDADSVITGRDGLATDEWTRSDKMFHAMRDCGTHTELLLAGLWGCVVEALPPFELLIGDFFKRPLESVHFADQYFLRQYVWPYARTSLLQHDSMFGFFEGRPFPDGPTPKNFHVGWPEGATRIAFKTDRPDGEEVSWALYLIEGDQQVHVCTYPSVAHQGTVSGEIPARYADRLEAGTAAIRQVLSHDIP